jgi:hypothetical protein
MDELLYLDYRLSLIDTVSCFIHPAIVLLQMPQELFGIGKARVTGYLSWWKSSEEIGVMVSQGV